MTITSKNEMSDEQAVTLIRNALIVAGQEMGADGDHWPVIKSTIHNITRDFENLKIEQNVLAEVKKYHLEMMRNLDAVRKTCSDTLKIEIDVALNELQNIHNDCFSPVDRKNLYVAVENVPEHIFRAKAIIDTLEEDDG